MANTQPAPFSRLTHPDPATNRVVQDLYDKLSQIWSKVNEIQQKK